METDFVASIADYGTFFGERLKGVAGNKPCGFHVLGKLLAWLLDSEEETG